MALIACPECKQQISDSAASCPHCGFPVRGKTVAAPAINTPAPAESKSGMGIGTKIVLGVVGLFIVIMFIGSSVPENERRANEAFKVCQAMFVKGMVATMYECQQMKDRIKRSGS